MSETSYAATHAALRRTRGSAVGLPCHRCGRRSSGWACTASPADRVTGRNSEGRTVTYSLDLTQYAAACDTCRAATDREHAAERAAVAGLALSPIAKRSTPGKITARELEPEPERLF